MPEASSDRNEQSPQGYMIGYARKAYGTQNIAIAVAQSFQAIIGHHFAMGAIVGAGIIVGGKLQLKTTGGCQYFKDFYGLRQNFLSNSITRDGCNLIGTHVQNSYSLKKSRR